jgi:hypothetical protein
MSFLNTAPAAQAALLSWFSICKLIGSEVAVIATPFRVVNDAPLAPADTALRMAEFAETKIRKIRKIRND